MGFEGFFRILKILEINGIKLDSFFQNGKLDMLDMNNKIDLRNYEYPCYILRF